MSGNSREFVEGWQQEAKPDATEGGQPKEGSALSAIYLIPFII